MQGGYEQGGSMDTSDDSDSDWDEGAALVAQAIIGFEEGKYRVQWEGEGDSTLESPTFALAESAVRGC